jgi:hypothetical protein
VAYREKVRENAAHLLQPGELVQQVFQAQTRSAWLPLISLWAIFLTKLRLVLVTDRRILVYATGRLHATTPYELIAELPRNTLIGPTHGLWYKTQALGPKALFIGRTFHKDVAAADALVDPSAA